MIRKKSENQPAGKKAEEEEKLGLIRNENRFSLFRLG
jgi:hypothetical protein